eukprot:g19312.t1
MLLLHYPGIGCESATPHNIKNGLRKISRKLSVFLQGGLHKEPKPRLYESFLARNVQLLSQTHADQCGEAWFGKAEHSASNTCLLRISKKIRPEFP